MRDAYGLCTLCRSLDRDGSGRITVNELQEALASLGVPVDADIAGKMVELIDVDGSSDISFQEFRRFAVLLPQSQASITPKLYSQTHWHLLGSQCGTHFDAQASKADLFHQVWHPLLLELLSQSCSCCLTLCCQAHQSSVDAPQITNAGIVLDWLDCASWMDGVEYRLGRIPTREPLQRLMAGGIAGAFSRTGEISTQAAVTVQM